MGPARSGFDRTAATRPFDIGESGSRRPETGSAHCHEPHGMDLTSTTIKARWKPHGRRCCRTNRTSRRGLHAKQHSDVYLNDLLQGTSTSIAPLSSSSRL